MKSGKYLLTAILLSMGMLAPISFAAGKKKSAEIVDPTLPTYEYFSIFNGKHVSTDAPKDFKAKGGDWNLGDKMRFDVSSKKDQIKGLLRKKIDRQWFFASVAAVSEKESGGGYVMVFFFYADKDNQATIIVNMEGDIWGLDQTPPNGK